MWNNLAVTGGHPESATSSKVWSRALIWSIGLEIEFIIIKNKVASRQSYNLYNEPHDITEQCARDHSVNIQHREYPTITITHSTVSSHNSLYRSCPTWNADCYCIRIISFVFRVTVLEVHILYYINVKYFLTRLMTILTSVNR